MIDINTKALVAGIFASLVPACAGNNAAPANHPAKETIDIPTATSSPKPAGRPAQAVNRSGEKAAQGADKKTEPKDPLIGAHQIAIPAPADVAAPPPGASTTGSGLRSIVLQAGTGNVHPARIDKVEVHYTGWMQDGRMFDSSMSRGKPAHFTVKSAIPGLTEGLQLMTKGEKRRFWIPADLAYGVKSRGPGYPFGQLTFDVELLDIVQAPVVAVPVDVSGPPAGAKRTPSGLAYRVLKPGTGNVHPGPTSRVKVHYSGWTTNGKMFDSSVQRMRSVTFPLSRVIKGWTEGVQLMVEGETTRFWIPADLAYGNTSPRKGAPAGMLVFDIELISIETP